MKLPMVFLMAATLAACGPNIHLKQYATLPPPAFCDPRTFERAEEVPTGSTLLAEVGYGDTGFSVSCGVARNKARLRTYACSIGADAIKIGAENYPNFVSTCYRVRASLYKLPPGAAAAPAAVPATGDAAQAAQTSAAK